MGLRHEAWWGDKNFVAVVPVISGQIFWGVGFRGWLECRVACLAVRSGASRPLPLGRAAGCRALAMR